MNRMGFLGSSDVAAALGRSRWTTPLQLWAIKSGKIDSPDLSDNEAVEWGTRLEDVVATKFAEKHNVKVMAYKKRFTHPEHEIFSCELDRIITGTDELVECKTCSAYKMKEWEGGDDIPEEYLLQVMFALGLSGRKKGHIAVLIGGNTYREKEVIFDQELYDMIIAGCLDFWSMVESGEAPVATYDDGDVLFSLYPEDVDEVIELDEKESSKVSLLLFDCNRLNSEIKAREKAIDEKKNMVKQLMGDCNTLNTDDFKATWKNQSTSRIDTKKLKEEKPEIYNDYLKESQSRVFRFKQLKKEND